jgi:hypothetical protein
LLLDGALVSASRAAMQQMLLLLLLLSRCGFLWVRTDAQARFEKRPTRRKALVCAVFFC